MELLTKNHNSLGNDDKYYIDCSKIDTSSIKPIELVKHNPITNRNRFDTVILHAITQNDIIKKKNRHIVVKIGRTKTDNQYMAQKEYAIGKQLVGINGFIKFLCIFSCYDDTTQNLSTTQTPIPTNIPICTSENKKDEKFVLVMPYIKEGSMQDYSWTINNIEFIKILIIHAVLSLTEAYIKIGFIHGDLHFGNILFKKTTKHKIVYEIGEKKIPFETHGYKVVLMDFEKSVTGSNQHELFWSKMRRAMIFDITTADSHIYWKNDKALTFIERMTETKQPPGKKIEQFMNVIDDSIFKIIQNMS
jgi:serine/threonine protein kinase